MDRWAATWLRARWFCGRDTLWARPRSASWPRWGPPQSGEWFVLASWSVGAVASLPSRASPGQLGWRAARRTHPSLSLPPSPPPSSVHRRPHVAVLSTGDEVCEPDAARLEPGQIRWGGCRMCVHGCCDSSGKCVSARQGEQRVAECGCRPPPPLTAAGTPTGRCCWRRRPPPAPRRPTWALHGTLLPRRESQQERPSVCAQPLGKPRQHAGACRAVRPPQQRRSLPAQLNSAVTCPFTPLALWHRWRQPWMRRSRAAQTC